MRFARFTFVGAGIWGITVLTPFYWLVDVTGRVYRPPIDYPHFFYGFLSVAMAWQIAFLVIGSDPARFRPLMLVGVVEKLGHVFGVLAMYRQARITTLDAQGAIPDLVLALAFVAAFVASRSSPRRDAA